VDILGAVRREAPRHNLSAKRAEMYSVWVVCFHRFCMVNNHPWPWMTSINSFMNFLDERDDISPRERDRALDAIMFYVTDVLPAEKERTQDASAQNAGAQRGDEEDADTNMSAAGQETSDAAGAASGEQDPAGEASTGEGKTDASEPSPETGPSEEAAAESSAEANQRARAPASTESLFGQLLLRCDVRLTQALSIRADDVDLERARVDLSGTTPDPSDERASDEEPEPSDTIELPDDLHERIAERVEEVRRQAEEPNPRLFGRRTKRPDRDDASASSEDLERATEVATRILEGFGDGAGASSAGAEGPSSRPPPAPDATPRDAPPSAEDPSAGRADRGEAIPDETGSSGDSRSGEAPPGDPSAEGPSREESSLEASSAGDAAAGDAAAGDENDAGEAATGDEAPGEPPSTEDPAGGDDSDRETPGGEERMTDTGADERSTPPSGDPAGAS
jgi:hypothetical protein